YRWAVGADKIDGRDNNGVFRTAPFQVAAEAYHTLVEVNPAEGAEAVTCEIVLDPGRTLTGTALDPDGKPLAGVRASGLARQGGWERPQRTGDFPRTGVDPGRPRLLEFAHKEKGLAGFLLVKGAEAQPLTVKLGPSGTLTGRLVTPDGKPVTDGR